MSDGPETQRGTENLPVITKIDGRLLVNGSLSPSLGTEWLFEATWNLIVTSAQEGGLGDGEKINQIYRAIDGLNLKNSDDLIDVIVRIGERFEKANFASDLLWDTVGVIGDLGRRNDSPGVKVVAIEQLGKILAHSDSGRHFTVCGGIRSMIRHHIYSELLVHDEAVLLAACDIWGSFLMQIDETSLAGWHGGVRRDIQTIVMLSENEVVRQQGNERLKQWLGTLGAILGGEATGLHDEAVREISWTMFLLEGGEGERFYGHGVGALPEGYRWEIQPVDVGLISVGVSVLEKYLDQSEQSGDNKAKEWARRIIAFLSSDSEV